MELPIRVVNVRLEAIPDSSAMITVSEEMPELIVVYDRLEDAMAGLPGAIKALIKFNHHVDVEVYQRVPAAGRGPLYYAAIPAGILYARHVG